MNTGTTLLTPPRRPVARGSGARRAVVAAGALLLLGGCLHIQPPQPDRTRYYVLTAPAGAAAPSGVAKAAGLPQFLNHVEVPGYLLNKPLATRVGPNEVKFDDDVRWAEPLDQGIARVLRARLAALTGVFGMAAPDVPHDYEVTVRVVRCEGDTEEGKDSVRFAADLELLAPSGTAAIAQRSFAATPIAWDGKDYGQLVSGLSRAVSELADAIVALAPPKE